MFCNYLKDKLKVSGYTFNVLIAKLQLSKEGRELFKNLDIVTVSRWVNGRTEPSVSKQLHIIRFFESELLYGIDYLNPNKVPNAFERAYSQLFDQIESSYHSLMLSPKSERKNCLVEHYNLTPLDLSEKLGLFYSRMNYYINSLIINKKNIDLFTIEDGSEIIAHVSVARHSDFLNTLFGFNECINLSVPTINVGYFPDRNCYETLLGVVGCYLIDSYDNTIFNIVVRGYDFLKLFEFFNAKVISIKQTYDVGNLYLLEIDLDKLLTHPYIIHALKENKGNYFSLMGYPLKETN